MGGGPPGFPRDSPCPAVLGPMPSPPPSVRLRGCHPLRPPVPGRSAPLCGRAEARQRLPAWPPTPTPQRLPPWHGVGLGRSPFRSPLLRASRLLPLPRGTEMFQFPRFPSPPYAFRRGCPGITRGGLPHSETHGSTPVDGSPWLFAVPRVLHRPSAPRHPPRAPSRSAPPRGGPEPPGSNSLDTLALHLLRTAA